MIKLWKVTHSRRHYEIHKGVCVPHLVTQLLRCTDCNLWYRPSHCDRILNCFMQDIMIYCPRQKSVLWEWSRHERLSCTPSQTMRQTLHCWNVMSLEKEYAKWACAVGSHRSTTYHGARTVDAHTLSA